jgi:hypothetical protein
MGTLEGNRKYRRRHRRALAKRRRTRKHLARVRMQRHRVYARLVYALREWHQMQSNREALPNHQGENQDAILR